MVRRFVSYLMLPLVLAAVFAHASLKPVLATEPLGDTNPIDKSVEDLLAIRDDDALSDAEKLANELETRRVILNDILNLSTDEVANLKGKLTKLPDFDKGSLEYDLTSGYLNDLDAYGAYFDAEKQKTADAASLDDVRTLAAEIKAYRASEYSTKIQQIFTFTLLYYNEGVIKIAENRLEKVTSDVGKLERLGLIKPSSMHSQLDSAASLISEASKLQDKARSEILTGEATDVESDDVAVPPSPRELLEKSLNEVKDAYGVFLQIGKDIRKTLGLK
jgi:hypothetical protein